MKKLFSLVLTLWYGALTAQSLTPQNSIALVAGPNWFQHLSSGIDGGADFEERMGYSIGADYTLELSAHWHILAGFRFHELKYTYSAGPLYWPSEYSTGQYIYDPTLPHFINTDVNVQALQYLAGIRWLSKPKTWRFYFDAETGLTDYIEQNSVSKDKLKFTLGLGLGLAWQPAKSNTAVFAQPVVRYIFQSFGSDFYTVGYSFLIPAVEAGVRRYF